MACSTRSVELFEHKTFDNKQCRKVSPTTTQSTYAIHMADVPLIEPMHDKERERKKRQDDHLCCRAMSSNEAAPDAVVHLVAMIFFFLHVSVVSTKLDDDRTGNTVTSHTKHEPKKGEEEAR